MKMNAPLRVVVVAAVLATSGPSQASPEFMAYEGRNAIHEGQGGEKKVVNGIEFWFNGDPPRRFKVLGAISDRRMKTGIYGAIRMSGLQADIAKAATAAGGDAVIMQAEGDDVLGVGGFGNNYTSGSAYGGASTQAHSAAHSLRQSRRTSRGTLL